jgi:UPF0755 protein
MTDSDQQDLFFGSPDDDFLLSEHPQDGSPDAPAPDARDESRSRDGRSRLETRRESRQRKRHGVVWILALVLILVVGVSAWFIGRPIYNYFNPSDYSGGGTGSVIVTVHANDGASQIGDTLAKDGVVASSRAFTDVASDNKKSQNIQPGSYRLRKHMSAKAALALLLDPSVRLDSATLVPEGATTLDIEKRLTAPVCTAKSPSGTICGLGLSQAVVVKAVNNVKALGLPTDFTVNGRTPTSVEGFLFPATYPFDDTTDATDALQQMVSKFTDEARSTNFTPRAKALGITPYDELIIASIAQAEAKYPADMAKVARVILNRITSHTPLRIDATSSYECKVQGVDPTKCIYADVQGAYNTYNHLGLPPTPISNPGAAAMNAAAHPAAGNWTFYVNGDAAGHLFFTNSEAAFTRAAAKCKANHWGCG